MERKLVQRSHWQAQMIEVVDLGDRRALYFGGKVLQSCMSLSMPQHLALSYTRYMMAALLVVAAPLKVLVVGVGAGSLIRFLQHHFPAAQIDGVDNSDEVLELARRHFHLAGSPRVKIRCCDGFEFLLTRTEADNYDLILVDAFDGEGMAEPIYQEAFFERCLDHLSLTGVASINLWSSDQARMEKAAEQLAAHFDSIVELPVPDRGNIICLAGRGDLLAPLLAHDREDLAELQQRYHINFPEIVRTCRRYNLSPLQRLRGFFR